MDKRIVPNAILLEDAAALMNEGHEVCFTPLGNSMLPFIRGGVDPVRLRKMPSVAVGDILLCRYQGKYVLHRLIAMEGDKLTLMGDGNIRGTEQCRLEDVLGTVVAIERNGKSIAPGKGRWWKRLLPIRRYILALYRRLP